MKTALFITCYEEWYFDRLEPIISMIKKKDYNVICAVSDFNHRGKHKSNCTQKECIYIHVPPYRKNISVERIVSHVIFGYRIKLLIKKTNPDLIYLVLPPNNTARCCRHYKQRYPETRLVVDIIDLWPESIPLGRLKKTLLARIWKKWRDETIKIADHVFTECNLYREKLENVLPQSKSSTLYLFKDQTEEERALIQKIVDNRVLDNHKIQFAYLGSMNNIIDIDSICEVIKQFMDLGYECELSAIGDGESREKFERSVKSCGCTTHFYGTVFDEMEKIKILVPCDYAFNMMHSDISVGLTIKSIDYLSYGLPLINNIKGDTWTLVENEQIGLNVNDSKILRIEIDHNSVLSSFDKHFTREAFVKSVNGALL